MRAIAYAALVGWVWLALRPQPTVETARGSVLASALPRWTLTSVERVQVQLDTVPDALRRDWLIALRRAGTSVSWASRTITPVAIEAYPSNEPAGGAIVLAALGDRAARPSDTVSAIVSDQLGPIDSLRRSPVLIRLGDPRSPITLTAGRQPARAEVARANASRRILVAAEAGWEPKFIIAALEEAGWDVDAHLVVGPGNTVGQGPARALDTARYAAVILADSVGVSVVRGVESFVRQGGGVIVVGEANRSRGVAPMVAWRAGRRQTPPLGTLPGDTLWRGLGRVPLDSSSDRAVVLERRDGRPVVVARRYHSGRVLGVGYDDTWRWRMAGGERSLAEHRDWWARLVASVALRSAPSASVASGAAPLATLHAALGPASEAMRTPPLIPRALLMNILGAVALASLLAEWVMRRVRGAR